MHPKDTQSPKSSGGAREQERKPEPRDSEKERMPEEPARALGVAGIHWGIPAMTDPPGTKPSRGTAGAESKAALVAGLPRPLNATPAGAGGERVGARGVDGRQLLRDSSDRRTAQPAEKADDTEAGRARAPSATIARAGGGARYRTHCPLLASALWWGPTGPLGPWMGGTAQGRPTPT